MKKIIYCFLGLVLFSDQIKARERNNINESQVWIGCMTSGKINEHFAL
ncbi:hypothetical protein [Elizabethkingia sp. JS20170427COW]|nr:hypothetical protein [Elizabethkingia sp. JS20170427COW]